MKPHEPEIESFPTMPGKEANIWGKKILKQSDEFAEQEGLGACGPVADNLVNELQANGRKARVMFNEFGEGGSNERFAHYVAVELNEKNQVTKIYDPTNPFAKKPIIKLTKGAIDNPEQVLKEYFGKGTEYEIFKKAGRSIDDGLFDKGQITWWKNKLGLRE